MTLQPDYELLKIISSYLNWPAIVLVLFLVFKEPLTALLNRLNSVKTIKHNGTELIFEAVQKELIQIKQEKQAHIILFDEIEKLDLSKETYTKDEYLQALASIAIAYGMGAVAVFAELDLERIKGIEVNKGSISLAEDLEKSYKQYLHLFQKYFPSSAQTQTIKEWATPILRILNPKH